MRRALIVLVLVLGSRAADAATITVGPGCSLAQAIVASNTDTAVGACAAGSGVDTIQLPCAFKCGTGICEKGETCATCHADCPLLGLAECGGACDPSKGASCAANFACVPTSGGKVLAAPFELGNGACGAGCFVDAECPDGACLHLLGLDVPGVCGAACTPGSALCPSGEVCVAKGTDATSGVCLAGGLCDPSGDGCAAGAPGESCIALDGAPDLGVCLPGCFVRGTASCALGSCHAKKDAAWHAGTCAGQTTACDVATQTGCAGGETCQAVGGGPLGGASIACVKFGGNAAVGQGCAEGQCAPGFLCHEGTCRSPCAPGINCAVGVCTDVGGTYGLEATAVRVCL